MCFQKHYQAYTSQIVVMVMLALAIGSDTISSQKRREAIIDGLLDLPCKSSKLEQTVLLLETFSKQAEPTLCICHI